MTQEQLQAALEGAAPSWSSADPDGSVGVDFVGTRAANLEMLSALTGVYNNQVVSARQHAILAWAAWRFRRNWDGAATVPTTADWRAFIDTVETIQLVGQAELGTSVGGVSGGLGRDSRAKLTDDDAIPMRFEVYERDRTNTSALAAVQYGPSAKLGGLGFLASEGEIVAATDSRGVALATAMDGLLRRSPRYGVLTRRDPPATLRRQDAVEIARYGLFIPGATHPERPERAPYVAALFRMDGVPSPPDRRAETAALILALVERFGAKRATAHVLRRYLLASCTAEGTRLEVPAELQDTAKRWRIFQLRQLEKYALEAWLRQVEVWMGQKISSVRGMIEETGRQLRADAGLPGLAALLSRPAIDAQAGFFALMGAMDAAGWAARNRHGPWELIFDHLAGAAAGAPAANLALTLGTLASVDACVPPDPELRRFADIGGRPRISLLYFADWWRRRGAWTLGDVLAELLEELVLQQHVGIAVARFDNLRRRLRFCNGEAGWELLSDTVPATPPLTPDRLDACLQLLGDLALLDEVGVDGGQTVWRIRPEGRDAWRRFVAQVRLERRA